MARDSEVFNGGWGTHITELGPENCSSGSWWLLGSCKSHWWLMLPLDTATFIWGQGKMRDGLSTHTLQGGAGA